jgi:hypothetical protein
LARTIDTPRTHAEELSHLFFGVALSIQLADALMKTHSLALTSTTFLSDCCRQQPLGSRTCFASAAWGRLFEQRLLLAKALLQGWGKVLRVA